MFYFQEKKKKPKKNFELKSEKKKKIVIEPSLTDYRGTNPRILQKKKKKEQIPKSKINSKSEITKGLKQTQRVKTEQRANASEESEQRLSSLVIRDRSSPEHAVVVVGDRSLVVACPSSEIARHYLSGLSLQASLLGCFSARCSLPQGISLSFSFWLSLSLSVSLSLSESTNENYEMKLMNKSLSLFIL